MVLWPLYSDGQVIRVFALDPYGRDVIAAYNHISGREF